ncbi:Uncharacterised protein [Vibrio cholerae]|nr:Uncharacterised protein [Vibrio cholerae]
MFHLLTPHTCAASINSLLRRLKVWPRTIRAISSHAIAPIATKISTMLRPKNVTNTITKNMNGIAYKEVATKSISTKPVLR